MWRSVSTALVVLLAVMQGGCADLRGTTREWGARLVGREPVSPMVAGVTLADLSSLGVRDAPGCRELVEADQAGRLVSSRVLQQQWLPMCGAAVEDAQAHARWLAEAQRLIDEAWQMLEQERIEREQREARQQALENAIRDRQQAAEQQARQVEREERIVTLRDELEAAQIHDALRAFQDKPMGYTLADKSARSMKEFLACIELAYPNKGYEVSYSGHVLSVKVLKASSLRGSITIEARFYETGDVWLLNYLRVAEMEAPSAQDRFILAQNLMASHCYAIDGLL